MELAPQQRSSPAYLPLSSCCKNTETPLTTFRINTCKSVSKQRTLTPFRMNTYKKQGEGGTQHFRVSGVQPPDPYDAPRGPLSPVHSLDCAYFPSPRGCTLRGLARKTAAIPRRLGDSDCPGASASTSVLSLPLRQILLLSRNSR